MSSSYHVYECEGERGRQTRGMERESERETERGTVYVGEGGER
jgi:hypothetical protein